jgi:predicted secreted hydrolase
MRKRRGVLALVGLAFLVRGFAAEESTTSPWVKASPDHVFEFPRDHRAHDTSKTEWWYFTGHLDAADAPGVARFGYQFTLFRIGIDPQPAREGSRWAANALVMGHAALTDLRTGEHVFSETLWRASGDLGGFPREPDPVIAWSKAPAGTSGRWELRQQGDGFAFTMRDDMRGVAFALDTQPTRPVVLHGERGYSKKSEDGSAASQYASFTRMATQGSVRWRGDEFAVVGSSWMDHEFSSGQLAKRQVGWDWFSIQLEDGRDLMLYVLRRADGAVDYASGTWVDATGNSAALRGDEFTITGKPPSDGSRYPTGFDVRVGDESFAIEAVTPRSINASVLVDGIEYFEGPITVKRDGRVVGRGYVELTGYDPDAKLPI